MGSSASKSIDHESTVTPVGHRSCSRNVFQNSCIRPESGSSDNSDTDDDDDDDEQVSDHQPKENNILNNHSTMSSSKSKGKLNQNKDIKMKRPDKRSYIPSETHFGEWGESSLSGSSHNPSSSFLSHFSFFSGNQSSRSSRAYLESSTSSIMSNNSNNKTKTGQGCDIFPSCFKPTSSEPQDSDSDSSDVSSIYESGQTGNNNNEMESNHRVFSPRNGSGYGGNRRVEGFEPIEQNIRFSRTLSVGRLRDRVLNRPIELASEREMIMSHENMTSSSNMSNSFYTNHILEVERMNARETSYPNLLEHRANFLERRRRIRSQVHALQRMGSRFENLSGHERSCVLSGQHQTGQCTCRVNNQDSNNARGSISRIVLLAEALSEVLDEIHQQSVVSSSRYALSSTGSVPAPTEVVESLPVKLYRKESKHLKEEDAQCYICLVEYEDGDEVRVLPCHHEFHRLCIDKWLKEIHRICPLCRGDICKTASLPAEGFLQL